MALSKFSNKFKTFSKSNDLPIDINNLVIRVNTSKVRGVPFPTTPNNQMKLFVNDTLSGKSSNISIDWGDNSPIDNVIVAIGSKSNITHTYTNRGVYNITISGTGCVSGSDIGTSNIADNFKIIDILSWGNFDFTSLNSLLQGSSIRSRLYASGTPNLNNCVSIANCFLSTIINDPKISNWNTINVSNMSRVFGNARSFNQPLNSWNTSNANTMVTMFMDAISFNQPLNTWDTTKVKDMNNMFQNTPFNQDISSWNISNVGRLDGMFSSATSFNQPLNSWDTTKVGRIDSMFNNATAFNQPLDNWNTTNVLSLTSTFQNASSFDQDINSWDTSNVITMINTFLGAVSFDQPLNNWDTGKTISMNSMFFDAVSFDQPLNNWNTSNVTNMNGMLQNATTFNQDLSDWCVTNITTQPVNFDTGATSWTLPRPVWGTCPP
jgi:surface protein